MTHAYIYLAILLTLLLSCKGEQGVAVATEDHSLELPLPQIPQNITQVEQRAGYLLLHFWDEMDFSDRKRSTDTLWVETNVVNWFSVFPHTTDAYQQKAVSTLLHRAASTPPALSLLMHCAEKYLAERHSPMRNDACYIHFLEAYLTLPNLSTETRNYYTFLLEKHRKNAVGTVAADFLCVSTLGRYIYLSTFAAEHLLLLFYDPSCTTCATTIRQLSQHTTVNSAIRQGSLKVLAVSIDPDYPTWQTHATTLPKSWTVAIDHSHLAERTDYDFTTMPVLYLLDSQKTVLLKETTLNEVEAYLNTLE